MFTKLIKSGATLHITTNLSTISSTSGISRLARSFGKKRFPQRKNMNLKPGEKIIFKYWETDNHFGNLKVRNVSSKNTIKPDYTAYTKHVEHLRASFLSLQSRMTTQISHLELFNSSKHFSKDAGLAITFKIREV